MVFRNTGGIAHDALEDFDQADDFNFESGFFAHFAMHGVFEPLTHFDDSARQ